MCPTLTFDEVNQWNREVREPASLASQLVKRLPGSAPRTFAYLSIAKDIWMLDKGLRNVLNDINARIGNPKPSLETLTPEQIETKIDAILALTESFRDLHTKVERLYGTAKKAGLTNRTLTGAAFNSARVRGEEFLDLAETIELALNPRINKVFEKAIEEYHRGEVFSLDEIS